MLIAILFASALAALALDQSVKRLVTARLPVGRLYGWRGGLGLQRIANRRLSTLPLSDRTAVVVWAAIVGCTTLVLALAPPLATWTALGLGLSVGGATGNLIDRLVRGAIVDFIVMWPWPTFNLADAAMVAGVGLVALSLL